MLHVIAVISPPATAPPNVSTVNAMLTVRAMMPTIVKIIAFVTKENNPSVMT